MQTQAVGALAPDMSQALSALLLEAQNALQNNPTATASYIGRAVDILAVIARAEGVVTAPVSGGLQSWRMLRVRQVIEAGIGNSISSADLATAAGLSPSRFAQAFKVSFGMSPHQYLMRARIERAKVLMLSSMDALSDIALACGLADQSHFSRLFQRLEGETPTAWRRRQVA